MRLDDPVADSLSALGERADVRDGEICGFRIGAIEEISTQIMHDMKLERRVC
jgi:hypothetical protein